MNEILQLTPDHVMLDENGKAYFHLTKSMKIKTSSGYRIVPVHDELARIGFLDFVSDRRKCGGGRLFPEVHRSSDEAYSTVFSKRFATFRKSLGIDDRERKLSFHSFRHNFRDACRLPDVNNDLVREMGGWARGVDAAMTYGSGASAEQLRPIMDKISYGIDLSHLYIDR